jgi:hypothetical protein
MCIGRKSVLVMSVLIAFGVTLVLCQCAPKPIAADDWFRRFEIARNPEVDLFHRPNPNPPFVEVPSSDPRNPQIVSAAWSVVRRDPSHPDTSLYNVYSILSDGGHYMVEFMRKEVCIDCGGPLVILDCATLKFASILWVQ